MREVPLIEEVYEELPLVRGCDNFYIAKLFDAATGASLPLSMVADIVCQFRDKRGEDAKVVISASVSGLRNAEGEVLVCVPGKDTANLSPGQVLWADLKVTLVTGHVFNKPVGGQAFRVIERVTQ